MLEIHEEDITQWYFGDQKENLLDWLCVERVLDENEQGNYKKRGGILRWLQAITQSFPSLELRFFWPAPQGHGKSMSFRMVDLSSKGGSERK